MIAISLWQPWASLWIVGSKIHETRHWRFPMRPDNRRIAVHASQKMVRQVSADLDAICMRALGPRWRSTLPRGALLGSIEVRQCIKVDDAFRASLAPAEIAQGNFFGDDEHPDRYAWEGAAPEQWAPINYIGRQGFFTLPREVVMSAVKLAEAA